MPITTLSCRMADVASPHSELLEGKTLPGVAELSSK